MRCCRWKRHIRWDGGSVSVWSLYWQSPGCVLNVSRQILILACLFRHPQIFFARCRYKTPSRICAPRISLEILCCGVLQRYYAGPYPVRRTGSFREYVLWSGLPQRFVVCQTRSFFGKPVLLQAVLSHMVLLSLHIYISRTDQRADICIISNDTDFFWEKEVSFCMKISVWKMKIKILRRYEMI